MIRLESLLKLENRFLEQIISHEKYVYQINFNLTRLLDYLKDPPLMSPEATRAEVASSFFERNYKFFAELGKLGEMLLEVTENFQTSLVEKKKLGVDWKILANQTEMMHQAFRPL